jgi:hypothetical protein
MMRKHQSVGEIISTFCFVGMAFYLLIFSLDMLESGENLRGFGGLLASVCCGLGGLRFVIANFVEILRKN